MNNKEIKVGQKVMHVGTVSEVRNHEDGPTIIVLSTFGVTYATKLEALRPYTEPTPERLFRKGDIVKINLRNGRLKFEGITEGKNYELLTDEKDGFPHIISDIKDRIKVAFSGLILVTPVEERKIYTVGEGYNKSFFVRENEGLIVVSFNTLPNAEALAQELADRLNREAMA